MADPNTITEARKAMLQLIKSKQEEQSNHKDQSKKNNQSKKKKNHTTQFEPANRSIFKNDLDQKRRSAYMIRLGGKMI